MTSNKDWRLLMTYFSVTGNTTYHKHGGIIFHVDDVEYIYHD